MRGYRFEQVRMEVGEKEGRKEGRGRKELELE